jgi:hypothetical protein
MPPLATLLLLGSTDQGSIALSVGNALERSGQSLISLYWRQFFPKSFEERFYLRPFLRPLAFREYNSAILEDVKRYRPRWVFELDGPSPNRKTLNTLRASGVFVYKLFPERYGEVDVQDYDRVFSAVGQRSDVTRLPFDIDPSAFSPTRLDPMEVESYDRLIAQLSPQMD